MPVALKDHENGDCTAGGAEEETVCLAVHAEAELWMPHPGSENARVSQRARENHPPPPSSFAIIVFPPPGWIHSQPTRLDGGRKEGDPKG